MSDQIILIKSDVIEVVEVIRSTIFPQISSGTRRRVSLNVLTEQMAEFSAVKKPLVGIFAIQGAVEEHADLVRKCGGDVKEVRKLHRNLAPQLPSI